MQTPAAPVIQPHVPARHSSGGFASIQRVALHAVVVLFAIYMLLPIALLLIGAFGETWTNTLLPTGVTGHWFADLAANTSFRRAFGVSLMVALACCCAAAVIGLPLAYALHYRSLSGRGMTARLVALLPVGVPALTLGFGYIAIFSGGLPTGVTGHWFADLAANTSFRRAFGVSLMVALACCCAAAVIGLPLAYALHYRSLSGRGMTARLVALLPVGVPALTLGFGYIAIFSGDTLPWLGSLPLLIAAHTVLTLPYLTQTLLSDLRHLGIARLEACAATLGATPLRQFFTIVLPNLRQSLFSGLVMVAALSIGEFQVSNLIAGFRYRNYPVVLLQAFYGATGMACAATVVLLCLAVIATLVSINTVQRLK